MFKAIKYTFYVVSGIPLFWSALLFLMILIDHSSCPERVLHFLFFLLFAIVYVFLPLWIILLFVLLSKYRTQVRLPISIILFAAGIFSIYALFHFAPYNWVSNYLD